MPKNSFAKKSFIMLFSLMLLTTSLLVGCDITGTTYVPKLDLPQGTDVVSNGGIAVQYGDYVYYVNSYVSDSTVSNKYAGAIKAGDIVRIKLSDLDDITKIHEEDLSTSDQNEKIENAVYEKVQLVVPKFYYSGNTTDTSVTGLYVYGNKLYYTTPNDALAPSGAVLNKQLSVYRVDLDGKNNTKLYTFQSNSQVNALVEKDNTVYALYVDTDLYSVSLASANGTAKKVCEKPTSVKFDVGAATTYYLTEDKDIASYTAGDEEQKILLKGAENLTYTFLSINQGYVYFTKADSQNSLKKFGVLAIKEGMTDPVRIFDSTDAAGGKYLGYGEKIVWTGNTYSSNPAIYQLFITDGANIASKRVYLLDKDSQNSVITLNKIEKDILYYTVDSVLYTLDLSKADEGTAAVENTKTAIAYSVASATGWANYDVVGKYVFSFSSNNTVVNESKEENGKWSNTTTTLTWKDIKEDE